jgi:hypothetical protein
MSILNNWFREAADTLMYALLVSTGRALSAVDAVSPKFMPSQSLRAPIMMTIWDATAAGALLGLLTIFTIRYIRSPWRKLPPGPRGLPILGNALQLVDKKWLFSRDCKERFGKSVIIIKGGPKVGSRNLQEKSCILMRLDSPQSCSTVSNQLSTCSNTAQAIILIVLDSSWPRRSSVMAYCSP